MASASVQPESQVPAPPAVMPPARRRVLRRPRNPVQAAVYALLLAGLTVAFLYPFVWALSASLKPREFALNNALIPNPFQPSNYLDVFRGVEGQAYDAPFARWFLNSAYIDTLAATTVTISSALVAFAFAYFRFPLRNLLFGFVLGSMMLPTAVTLIPTYLIWNKVGLTGTQYPLWMGNLFGSAFYIFLMRQFFLGIPREMFEAARMDGDNYWTMFWRMVVPLSKPALLVVFVFELKAKWTDLMGPLIYLRDDDQFTIPRGLYAMLGIFGPNAGGHGDYQVILAATVLATLPMIVIFFLGQKYFIEQGGIATQGRKG